jgi:hypothetical protein
MLLNFKNYLHGRAKENTDLVPIVDERRFAECIFYFELYMSA